MATTRHMSAPKEFHRYANTRHMQITRQNCLHNGGLTESVMCRTSHVCGLWHPAGPVTHRCEGHASPRCSHRTQRQRT